MPVFMEDAPKQDGKHPSPTLTEPLISFTLAAPTATTLTVTASNALSASVETCGSPGPTPSISPPATNLPTPSPGAERASAAPTQAIGPSATGGFAGQGATGGLASVATSGVSGPSSTSGLGSGATSGVAGPSSTSGIAGPSSTSGLAGSGPTSGLVASAPPSVAGLGPSSTATQADATGVSNGVVAPSGVLCPQRERFLDACKTDAWMADDNSLKAGCVPCLLSMLTNQAHLFLLRMTPAQVHNDARLLDDQAYSLLDTLPS